MGWEMELNGLEDAHAIRFGIRGREGAQGAFPAIA